MDTNEIKSNQILVFVERGKPLAAEKRTKKFNPHMTPIEPRPDWWERLRLYKRWPCSTYILNRVN